MIYPEFQKKEKESIINRYSKEGRIFCAFEEHSIDKSSDICFHSIDPFTADQKNYDINNAAVVCRMHKKQLGQLSINEYNTFKEMQLFFSSDRTRRLDDVLDFKLGSGNKGKKYGNLSFNNTSCPVPLTCPATGFQYFYELLPIEYINNDFKLQPRPLEFKRLWELYRHLLIYSQLTPSVCRLSGDMVYLFDGQHKAAAQIWANRKYIECKIYIEPVIKLLKEANLIAHDKLRQMPFFTSVLINKWASIFVEEWQEYMEQPGRKSEAGFTSFLVKRGKKRQEALNMLESNIFESIIEDKDNRIMEYIEDSKNSETKLLTLSRLKTSFFKKFITNPPLAIDIEESDKLREYERQNAVKILNLIVYYCIEREKNSNENNVDGVNKIFNMAFLNGAFKAVCGILKDVISNILELYDEVQRKEILLRNIQQSQWDMIEKGMEVLFSHRAWYDSSGENYSNLRNSSEIIVRKYLSKKGLSANRILSASYEEPNSFID